MGCAFAHPLLLYGALRFWFFALLVVPAGSSAAIRCGIPRSAMLYSIASGVATTHGVVSYALLNMLYLNIVCSSVCSSNSTDEHMARVLGQFVWVMNFSQIPSDERSNCNYNLFVLLFYLICVPLLSRILLNKSLKRVDSSWTSCNRGGDILYLHQKFGKSVD